MAVYGNNNGTIPFTGYTTTLGTNPTVGNTSGSVAFNALTQHDDKIAYAFQRVGSRATRRILLQLVGSAVGGAASETRARRPGVTTLADPNQFGGRVVAETVFVINRNTVPADVTNIISLLNRVPKPAAYVEDVSGNGGGGQPRIG